MPTVVGSSGRRLDESDNEGSGNEGGSEPVCGLSAGLRAANNAAACGHVLLLWPACLQRLHFWTCLGLLLGATLWKLAAWAVVVSRTSSTMPFPRALPSLAFFDLLVRLRTIFGTFRLRSCPVRRRCCTAATSLPVVMSLAAIAFSSPYWCCLHQPFIVVHAF